MKVQLRAITSQDRSIAALARDVQATFANVPQLSTIEFTRYYSEPMVIPLDHEPIGILMIRCRDDDDPESVLACSAVVDFTFTDDGASIPALQGPVIGYRYRFSFLMIG